MFALTLFFLCSGAIVFGSFAYLSAFTTGFVEDLITCGFTKECEVT